VRAGAGALGVMDVPPRRAAVLRPVAGRF
jgi:hypothetical protein